MSTALLALLALSVQNETQIPVAGSPVVDGLVHDDPGWNGAAKIDLDCPGTLAQTYGRLVRTATHVVLGVSVRTPGLAPDVNDRVVLALHTSDDAAAWRIHIQPFPASPPLGASTAAVVRYWRNSGTWSTQPAGSDPAGASTSAPWLLPTAVKIHNHGLSFWELELAIPFHSNVESDEGRTSVYFPAEGQNKTFSLYLNVLKTSSSGFVCQYPWRKTSPISGTLTGGTPKPPAWGVASFDPRLSANVFLYTTKIGLSAPPCPSTHEVVPLSPAEAFGDCAAVADTHQHPTTGPSNTFFAKPRNRLPAVAQVLAQFSVADWGVPAPEDWWVVAYPDAWAPPLANPAGPLPIASGLEGTIQLEWPLTYKQSCQLSVPQKSIRVTMSAPDGDDQTRFYDPEVERILDTVSASVFERDARIGTKGLRTPSDGRHAFVLTVGREVLERAKAPPRRPAAVRPAAAVGAAAALKARAPVLPDAELYESVDDLARRSFPPAVEQALSWTCRAFRKTGATLTFDDVPGGPTFDDTEQAGAFGYLAGHQGPVERWTSDFSGRDLRRVSDGVYAIDVPHGRQGLVRTRIEAEEFHRWAARFRFGFTAPHGDFADAVDGGWSETAGFEYRFDRTFSLEARLSVSSFDEDGGGSDVTLVGHSLNGRATFLDGDWRPFVNAGGGFYLANPGDDEFGLNAGGGVEWRATEHLSLEAGYDYHHVFTDDDDAQFSTIQAGVVLRF